MAAMADMIIRYLHCAERLFALRGSSEAAFRWPRERPGVPSLGRFAAQRAAGTQFRHIVSNIAMTITGNRAPANAHLTIASKPPFGLANTSGNSISQWNGGIGRL